MNSKTSSERGAALVMFTFLSATVLMPIMGLGIDMGVAYLAKSRLVAAADGAALAGARALNDTDANAKITAANYLQANFATNYLGSAALDSTVTIDNTVPHVRTVTVTARTSIPTYFLRLVNQPVATIGASAQSSRRDVNMMLVMDRSGSIANSGSCTDLKNAAQAFVNSYSEGHDSLGLVTFATTVNLDIPSSTAFTSSTTSAISSLQCLGGTSSAIAIDTANSEVLRVAQSNPGMLNVLVFFTDGIPTSYGADFMPTNPSSCNSGPGGFNGFDYRTQTNVDYRNAVPVRGLLYADNLSQAGLAAYTFDNQYLYATSSNGGCNFGSVTTLASMFPSMPEQDYRGNHADWLNPDDPNYTRYKQAQRNANGDIVMSSQNALIACINAADDAAHKGRYNGVQVFTIGLGADVDSVWLKRVANDPSSQYFTSAQPSGRYAFASDRTQLAQAFNYIRSQVMRLAQ